MLQTAMSHEGHRIKVVASGNHPYRALTPGEGNTHNLSPPDKRCQHAARCYKSPSALSCDNGM
jgi:hypothetical protein